MKRLLNCLQLTALFLAAASQGTMAAETPLRGSFQAVEIDAVQFPTLAVGGSGTGIAVQLGKFTFTYAAEVNLLTRVGVGTMEFVAANGDHLFADIFGQATPTGTPNVVSIVETWTITGGTGRFVDATGSVISTRFLDQLTGYTSGSFDGTFIH